MAILGAIARLLLAVFLSRYLADVSARWRAQQKAGRGRALEQLLAGRHPVDVRRGHRLTVEGSPDRFDVVPGLQVAAAVYWRVMRDNERGL